MLNQLSPGYETLHECGTKSDHIFKEYGNSGLGHPTFLKMSSYFETTVEIMYF